MVQQSGLSPCLPRPGGRGYWALASILVTAQNREIEELVGPDRLSVVGAQLEQNAKNVEHRTESLIARASQRLAQYRAGTLPAKVQMEQQSNPDLTLGLSYSRAETCPACGATGMAARQACGLLPSRLAERGDGAAAAGATSPPPNRHRRILLGGGPARCPPGP